MKTKDYDYSMNSNKKKIFIGVAWPYVNGDLHIGHVAGYLLPADISARFHRLTGKKVLMVSGSDTHGTPITLQADKEGTTPEEVIEKYHAHDVKLFADLGLSYDLYTRTNTPHHHRITQDFLIKFDEKGLLEIEEQQQYYSQTLKRFLPDRYVEGECPYCHTAGTRADQCEVCGNLLDNNLISPISKVDNQPVTLKPTKHLFISWDKLQPKIEEYYHSHYQTWRPWVAKETGKWLTDGLKKRPVTRDLDWGVKIPEPIASKLENSDSKRIYVWFDAVIGYYSASLEWSQKTGGDWQQFWLDHNTRHLYFMGKDNLVFHTIFWPSQLMVYNSDLKLPDVPVINQFFNLDGAKFSKSRGVYIGIREFIDKYGSDALRFYITAVLPESNDTSFTWNDFFTKNNEQLVGHIGNYIHRSHSLYQGVSLDPSLLSETVLELIDSAFTLGRQHLEDNQFRAFFDLLQDFAIKANGQFHSRLPWITKKNNPSQFASDSTDLIALSIALAALIEPITPNASDKYFTLMNLLGPRHWPESKKTKVWLTDLLSRIKLNPPQILFNKIDPKDII